VICLTLLKAILESLQKCILKNNPVSTCNIKHNPNSEPKFHKLEKFDGEGKS